MYVESETYLPVGKKPMLSKYLGLFVLGLALYWTAYALVIGMPVARITFSLWLFANVMAQPLVGVIIVVDILSSLVPPRPKAGRSLHQMRKDLLYKYAEIAR